MIISLSGTCTCNTIHSGIRQSRTRTCIPHLDLVSNGSVKHVPEDSFMEIEASQLHKISESEFLKTSFTKISSLRICRWNASFQNELLQIISVYPNIHTLTLEYITGDVYELVGKLPAHLTYTKLFFSPNGYFSESKLLQVFKNARIKDLQVLYDDCPLIEEQVEYYKSDTYKKKMLLFKSKIFRDVNIVQFIQKFI